MEGLQSSMFRGFIPDVSPYIIILHLLLALLNHVIRTGCTLPELFL